MTKISTILKEAPAYLGYIDDSVVSVSPYSCHAVQDAAFNSSYFAMRKAEAWYYKWLCEFLTEIPQYKLFKELHRPQWLNPNPEMQEIRYMLLLFASYQAEEEGL